MPEPAQPSTPRRVVYYTRIAAATPEGAQRLVANAELDGRGVALGTLDGLLEPATPTGRLTARTSALLAEYQQGPQRQRRAHPDHSATASQDR
jgi:hypothetical protein